MRRRRNVLEPILKRFLREVDKQRRRTVQGRVVAAAEREVRAFMRKHPSITTARRHAMADVLERALLLDQPLTIGMAYRVTAMVG
jgi:hypothetical protein